MNRRLFRLLAPALLLPLAAALALPTVARSANAPAISVQGGGTAPGRGGPLGVAPEDPTAVELLQLSDGRLLWAELVDGTDAGLELRRLDQGGRVTLPWRMLAPTVERDLRLRYGLLDIDSEELFVTAQRVPLVGGRETIGLIVERTDEALHLKTAGSLLVLPLTRISGGATDIEVPAREIFTRDELYQSRLADWTEALSEGGAKAAKAHESLALFSEQLYDFVRALEHWRAASELGLERADLSSRLAQAERKAAVQEQVDQLDTIDTLRARGKYAEAKLGLDSFLARYPRSPLLEDRAKLATKVEKELGRALDKLVPQRWHFWTQRLIRDAARTRGYQESLSWLDEGLSEEVLAIVVHEVQELAPGLGAADVRARWAARPKGRPHSATYGNATWLLGVEKARAGLADPEAEKPEAATENDAERKAIEDRVKRYLKNQEQASRSSNTSADPEDMELIWKDFGSNVRAQWMLAYYAENGGDMKLERVGFANCRTCGGVGVLEVLSTGSAASGGDSGTRLTPCPLCRQVGLVRRVHYR